MITTLPFHSSRFFIGCGGAILRHTRPKIRHSTPKNTIVFEFLSKNTFLYFLSVYFPNHGVIMNSPTLGDEYDELCTFANVEYTPAWYYKKVPGFYNVECYRILDG